MTQKNLIFLQAIVSFCLGASSLCLIILFSSIFPNLHFLYNSTSYAPWIEEGLKFLVILLLMRIAYITPFAIPFVGIGFGFMEGFFHIMTYGRFSLIPFWTHIILGFVMALFFYLAKNLKYSSFKSIWFTLALLIPVYLHLIYNIVVKIYIR